MAFMGKYFTFNGRSSKEFGLALYTVGTGSDDDVAFTSAGEIVEEWSAKKSKSFFYGLQKNEALTFTMAFGVDMSVDSVAYDNISNYYLTRKGIAEIADWLTGYNEQKWLEIDQADMGQVRYKCIISELKLRTYSCYPLAFTAEVTCDSPYGYLYPKEYSYTCSSSLSFTLNNPMTIHESYYPQMIITPSGTGDISIKNVTDSNNEFKLTSVPSSYTQIEVNNERGQILLTSDNTINLYSKFNWNWFKLLEGDNSIQLTGAFGLKLICSYPINIGA